MDDAKTGHTAPPAEVKAKRPLPAGFGGATKGTRRGNGAGHGGPAKGAGKVAPKAPEFTVAKPAEG